MNHQTDIIEQLPCLNLSYRKANRVISQIYDHAFFSVGLKCSQFSILKAVQQLGQTTNAELQELLVLEQTTLTRGLKPLIREDLIQSEPGQDKREKLLSLTTQGKKLYAKADKLWQQAQNTVIKKIGQETAEQILAMNKLLIALKL